jgi:hypothetical protein
MTKVVLTRDRTMIVSAITVVQCRMGSLWVLRLAGAAVLWAYYVLALGIGGDSAVPPAILQTEI